MSDKKYIEELKQYIDQLLLNNEMIDCIYVNPTDYNNYIMPLRKSASVNYDAPFFGAIDPIRIFGIVIRTNHHVPEGHMIKSPFVNPYIPLQVSHIVFDNEGKAKIKS